MPEERLLSSLKESESAKESEKNFDNTRIEKRKNGFNELRDSFKSKREEIRKDLYKIENKKKSFHSENKRDLKKSS